MTTLKIGGAPLASGAHALKRMEAIHASGEYAQVVVSAPGKNFPNDHKMTDILYAFWGEYELLDHLSHGALRQMVCRRFRDYCTTLGVTYPYEQELLQMLQAFSIISKDYFVSRGEYWTARIVVEAAKRRGWNWSFHDAKDLIKLNEDGTVNEAATLKNHNVLVGHPGVCIIPGFYGEKPDGTIGLLGRDSSDLSAVYVAALTGAKECHFWKDVPGLCVVDTRIIKDARPVSLVSFSELGEILGAGPSVLHASTASVLERYNITARLFNVKMPDDPGTTVVADKDVPPSRPGAIVGIVGRKGLTRVVVECPLLMDTQRGAAWKIFKAFDDVGLNIVRFVDSTNLVDVFVSTKELEDKFEMLKSLVLSTYTADAIVTQEPGKAFVSVVGNGMIGREGMLADVSTTVASVHANIENLGQGSERSITIFFREEHMVPVMKAIYSRYYP